MRFNADGMQWKAGSSLQLKERFRLFFKSSRVLCDLLTDMSILKEKLMFSITNPYARIRGSLISIKNCSDVW